MISHLIRFTSRSLAVSAFSLLLVSNLAQAAPPDPTTACEVAKLKAAGKKADCLAKEEAKAILGKPSNPAKCENVFIRAFATAEAAAAIASSACPVTGDVDEIEALVDTCVDDWAVTIAGTPPQPCEPCEPCVASQFPASGQTTAYTANKNDGIAGEVAVPDDGTLEAGATLSYTDNNTGLMWEKKDDLGGLHDKDNGYNWSGNGSQETIWDWLEDVNAEGGTGYAGHNDWRIPNRRELESLLDTGVRSFDQSDFWPHGSVLLLVFDVLRQRLVRRVVRVLPQREHQLLR